MGKMNSKSCFLLVSIFIILILNLGVVCASTDNLTLPDIDNNLLHDEIICDNIIDSSNLEIGENESSNGEYDDNNSIDDSAGPDFDDNQNEEPKNRDISNEFDEEYLEYVEDIQNSTSESYYDFFSYKTKKAAYRLPNSFSNSLLTSGRENGFPSMKTCSIEAL
jgi:hypothetical protein